MVSRSRPRLQAFVTRIAFASLLLLFVFVHPVLGAPAKAQKQKTQSAKKSAPKNGSKNGSKSASKRPCGLGKRGIVEKDLQGKYELQTAGDFTVQLLLKSKGSAFLQTHVLDDQSGILEKTRADRGKWALAGSTVSLEVEDGDQLLAVQYRVSSEKDPTDSTTKGRCAWILKPTSSQGEPFFAGHSFVRKK